MKQNKQIKEWHISGCKQSQKL